MEKLIGAAKEEDEDEFWAEHADYFQSSEEDDEFDEDDSDIGEDEREDSEDSDIDEDENEVDSDAEAAEAEKAVKRTARSGGKKGVYQDPALRRRRAASTMPRNKRPVVEIDPSETIAARKEKRQATGAAEERRKERRAAEARKKKPVRKAVVPERKLTAQEMFQEAARTEVINKASLERLLELEEEKRKEVIRKRVIVGPRVKFLSRTVQPDPNTTTSRRTKNAITLTDVSELKIANNKPFGAWRPTRQARCTRHATCTRPCYLHAPGLPPACTALQCLLSSCPCREWLRYGSATESVCHNQAARKVCGPTHKPSLR